MAYTIYNCTALQGGAERSLDALAVGDLATNDRAICVVDGELMVFSFDSTATDAEQVATHPYIIRPDDYSDGGNWVEAEIPGIVGVTATPAELNAAADGIGVSIPKVKIVEIGDWNMDSTAGVNVAHGIADYTKIRAVSATIRPDSGGTYLLALNHYNSATDAIDGGISQINATNIALYRKGSGTFDSVNFDSTSYNRGWITIWYVD